MHIDIFSVGLDEIPRKQVSAPSPPSSNPASIRSRTVSTDRIAYLQRGDEVLIDGEWYPVIGYALTHTPNAPTTGSVFTDKPLGRFEPCLGYRISYSAIEQVRRHTDEATP